MQHGLRSFRPLIQWLDVRGYAAFPSRCTTTQFPPVDRRLDFQKRIIMSSAPADNQGSSNRARKPHWRNRNRKAASNIAQHAADPQRATLAARLAVPTEETPVVSSWAPTPIVAATPVASRPSSPAHKANFSTVRFEDFAQNGQISKEQLKNIPFEYATEVQAKTLGHILAGKDVLARAKTGTGKTLAFLIPAIETLRRGGQMSPQGVASVLVISPTRELAQQIGQEAQMLVKGMPYGVQVIVGGGPKVESESKRLRNTQMDILIATPGRLVDHIQNASMRSQLSHIRFLILDEADRLLDQGFRRDLETILQALPNRQATPRQALLFSATVSDEVKRIGTLALLPEYQYVSTVADNESSTHEHVQQEHIIVEHDADLMPVVGRLVEERGKVICFLPTARATGLIAEVMDNVLSCPVYSIHSRMSQPRRTKAMEDFKLAPTGVLFSSDVTARGIDIPGVTCVIQAGLPASAEQYIHRLGRTARAGNEGHGILVLAKWEQFFLHKKDVVAAGLDKNLVPYNDTELINQTGPGAMLNDMRARVKAALAKTDEKSKEQAYIAWIGYYKSSLRDLGWRDVDLVQRANDMARDVFLYAGYQTSDQPSSEWLPPPILAKTIGMMGLREVRKHGLFNVQADVGQGGGRGDRGDRGGRSRNQGQGQGQGPGRYQVEANPLRESAEPQASALENQRASGSFRRRGRGRGRGRGN
ncbi:DEAD-box ATP-dependent RNA helicase [Rhizoctonia solani 123E]|uniref:ATP-dependent RNA helicase n=1 Tax=Rhizoctonia solani 123E TaxID=1423351 RepID=A0A074RXC4_9AGAM|nr:DEAD-box ATP-dependent RNA helicase [Rhizoctonia solani 123E]